ncbi:peptidase domain-containing ABC transporter [Flavobacterium sp.]|uniref:peptidase domain-containing ABC transporter n=1 Tax=Flavobacterium sp. TaxID=239 RepID=UPI0035299BA7
MKPIQRLKNLVQLDKKDFYQIIIYSIFSGLISLTLPLGIQSIVNLIQAGQISTSWFILVLVVVIGVILVGVFKIMQFRISENLQQKIFVRSSFEFAYRFPKIKFDQFYNQYLPELANRFFDTISIQKGITKLLLDISSAVLQIVFGLVLLSLYHPFFIAFGIILTFMLYIIFKANYVSGLETSLKESKYKYKVAHWIQEIARNHISFKNKNLFQFALQKNDDFVSKYLTSREQHFAILRRQFIQLIGFKTLITAGLLIIGGLLVINQQMNIGQFVAAEIIILTIITAIEKLFGGLELFYDVLTSLEKIGGVVDLEMDNALQNDNYNIEENYLNIRLNNVSYKYPKAKNLILNNVTFTIKQGDKIVLKGANGSGKTTFARIIGKIVEPTSGNLFINDSNAKSVYNEDYQSKIGYFASDTSSFEGTILENLKHNTKAITKAEIQKVLEIVKLDNYIKSLPNGLETMLYTNGSQINSSAIQKIVLARILLMKPKLIILEDALTKIDANQATEIFNYLLSPENPATVILISNQHLSHKQLKYVELINGQLIQ